MFADTLLESSPAHASVLKAGQWLLALAMGLAGFLAGFLLIPLFLPPAGARVLAVQSASLGATLTAYTLMLCYTHAEARRLRLRVWLWLLVTTVLNLPGFFAFLVRSAMKTGDWKRAALPAAYLLEVALVSGLILVPLIHTEALGKLANTRWLPPPLPRPGRAQGRPAPSRPAATPRPSRQGAFLAPPMIPPHISFFTEARTPNEDVDQAYIPGMPEDWPGGMPDGIPGGLFPGNGTPPPPASAVRREHKTAPPRIGGDVAAARAIHRPDPVYPELARITRTEGTVRLEAVIGANGTIQNLKVLSGHPLLVRAALEAVARWRYQPTLLNGEPVAVLTDIEVTFSLATDR